jgi:succinate dehydrogenase hydrophobic anchor subunit
MPATDRVVYGRSFRVTPLWLWWLQRISALALGPLAAAHILAPTWGRSAWLTALLLAVVVGHGYSGLKRIAPAARTAARTGAMAWIWAIVVLAAGILTIAALP